MIVRKVMLTGVVVASLPLLACRSSDEPETKRSVAKSTLASPGKTGTEQTRGPDPMGPYGAQAQQASSTSVPEVVFAPSDRMTAVGATPLRVALDSHGQAVGSSVLSTLSSTVKLRTWPELTPVPADVSVADFDVRTGDVAHVQVSPKTTLSQRWYVLSAELRPDYQWSGVARAHVLDAVTRGARFAVGSDPVLTSVRACGPSGKAGGADKLILDLSERVPLASAKTEVVLRQGGQPAACTLAPLRYPSVERLHYACNGLGLDQVLSVALNSLTSTGGHSVRLPGAVSAPNLRSIQPTEWKSQGTGCWIVAL